MKLELAAINWWAVLVAAAATFLLGGVWYTALFGKLWQRLHGYSDEKLKAMQAKRPPHVFFGVMIACYLVLAAVIGVVFASVGIAGAVNGATMGFLFWLGPAAAIGITSWLASDRHIGIYGIDLLYQLIFLVMMGAIIGGWR
jgi:uncharacterized protein DUF1761